MVPAPTGRGNTVAETAQQVSATPTSPPWLVRVTTLALDEGPEAAREALRRALADEPDACLRVPAFARVPSIDPTHLRPLLRRPAGAEELFRVPLPADGADAALLPVDPTARSWTLFVREGLDPRDEVRLLLHALGHRLLAHLRDGDPYGHWDRLHELTAPVRRWDREVHEVLGGALARGGSTSPPPGPVDAVRAACLARFVDDLPGMSPDIPFAPHLLPIEPWPHQVRVAREVVHSFPRRFLLCDEVGLGKTIETGLAIRELIHRGLAKRVLLLVPRSVHRQWREEMREKFNLHFVDPTANSEVAAGEANPWNAPASLLIASSHLVRRRTRQRQLLEAKPWDLVVVDEAHHARAGADRTPNLLLRLLRQLSARTRGLLILTATPLQVRVQEVYDLLDLTGLPGRFSRERDFVSYFERLSAAPTLDDLANASAVARAQWQTDGERQEARRRLEQLWRQQHRSAPPMAARNALTAPARDRVDLTRLSDAERATLRDALLRATPLHRSMFRHTRDLLRRYQEAGLLPKGMNVPRRRVVDPDPPIRLDAASEGLYHRIEEHLVAIHQAAESLNRGDLRARYQFLMGVYRQRLTSSFAAVRASLTRRAARLRGALGMTPLDVVRREEPPDLPDEDDLLEGEREVGDTGDEEEAELTTLSDRALARTELESLERFLDELDRAPLDAKLERLRADLQTQLRGAHQKVIVFTQFTDTLDDLRAHLLRWFPNPNEIACYSGRGGEVPKDGQWVRTTKEEIKARFGRGGDLRFLLCTDAASEGLNFQDCALLVNFDLPWNPMRVEQRIGRIDRIGQRLDTVTILNYFHEGTVEAEVYRRLRRRMNLFGAVVGRPQPILASLEGHLRGAALARGAARDRAMAELDQELGATHAVSEVPLEPQQDEELARPTATRAPLHPEELERLLVASTAIGRFFRPLPGIEGAYLYGDRPWRVTLRPKVADAHPRGDDEEDEGVELLSHGHPLFRDLLLALMAGAHGCDPLRHAVHGAISRGGHYCSSADGPEQLLALSVFAERLGAGALPDPAGADAMLAAINDDVRRWHGNAEALARTLLEARARRAAELLAPVVLIDLALQRLQHQEDEPEAPALASIGDLLRDLAAQRSPIPELLGHLPATSAAWTERWIDERLVEESLGRRRSARDLQNARNARARQATAWLELQAPLIVADDLADSTRTRVEIVRNS